MANKRIFYAVQRAGIAPPTGDGWQVVTIRGLQTLGVTTTFNLEQVFEIGQLAIYENIEGIPDVEVQTEKLLDGYTPVYLMATQTDASGTLSPTSTLIGRAMGQCNMAVAIYADTSQYAEGTPITEVQMSGLYVSSVGYSVSVDGNATETCTLVGNNKVWVIGGDTGNFVGYPIVSTTWLGTPWSGGTTNGPAAITGSGGVNRREDVIFGSGLNVSLLPKNIPGVTTAASNSGINVLGSDGYGVHVQSWNINVDFGREELFELGRKSTYYRYVNFPVEVTNEFTVISTSGDLISATEEGIYAISGTGDGSCGDLYNLTDQPCKLVMCEGLRVDCGILNKLSSVGVSGGDTGGGNMEVTYSYSNCNDFDVRHPPDPNTGLWPDGVL